MDRYVSVPQHVEAYRFRGTSLQAQALGRWIRGEGPYADLGLVSAGDLVNIEVPTPRGPMKATKGDWIVKSLEAGFFTVIPHDNFTAMFKEH